MTFLQFVDEHFTGLAVLTFLIVATVCESINRRAKGRNPE